MFPDARVGTEYSSEVTQNATARRSRFRIEWTMLLDAQGVQHNSFVGSF